MRSAARVLAWSALAAAMTAGACAETFYVDQASGDDAAGGGSWQDAFATVTRGIEAARLSAGGLPRVNVAAGTYAVADVVMDFPVLLVGGYPPGGGPRDRLAQISELDAGGADHVLTFEEGSAGAILDGFTVRGAAAVDPRTGEREAAVEVRDAVVVRNCVLADNDGLGVRVIYFTPGEARIERNLVLRNGGGGILAGTDNSGGCQSRAVVVANNLVEDNSSFGIVAGNTYCPPENFVVRDNRIRRTRRSTSGPDGVGLAASCCPLLFNNEVSGSEGAGISLAAPFESLPGWLAAALSHFTVTGSGGPAVRVGAPGEAVLTISRSILWGNAGGDIDGTAAAGSDISYNLSEGPLPGPGNIAGADPLLVSGPRGDAYLSQIASGQAADSPALDAGAVTAVEAGLAQRTTRTDDVRDAGPVDLGFHAEPTSFTLSRGTDAAGLSPYASGIVPPVPDPGAAGPFAPPRLYYRLDSDGTLIVRRSGTDLDIRFAYQAFD